MAEIIVVTSGKGGVGKTTSSASLACGLARRGKKVSDLIGPRKDEAAPAAQEAGGV